MASDESKEGKFMFEPAQPLWGPVLVGPTREGFVSANLQFVIPRIQVSEDRRLEGIARHCGEEVVGARTQPLEDGAGTLVSIGFYVPRDCPDESVDDAVENYARLVLERFMGILSFYAGAKCSALHAQTRVVEPDGTVRCRLNAAGRADAPQLDILLPDKPFGGKLATDGVFAALFWLRRGLAERDLLETYAALMVCLECVAREIDSSRKVIRRCPKCGHETESDPGAGARVRHLVVDILGADRALYERIWKARNAVTAHGGKTVTVDVLQELAELKFEVAVMCYRGIKRLMGIGDEEAPSLRDSFFATSILMYLD